jgi:steroid Delta-isomerase
MKLQELIAWYEQLSPERLGEIGRLYEEGATFRDPFNDVCGQEEIENIFRHMFDTIERACFEVIDWQTEGNIAWLRWNFSFVLKGRAIAIEGASRLIFGEDGRVADHRDYWDAMDLFLQLPLLGTMFRHLRQRLSAPPSSSGEESDNQ